MSPSRAGHMHWNIADWCNYRCSYCCEGRFQPNLDRPKFLEDALLDAGLRFLATLDKGWTVRLSSGEPSAHPRLLDLTRGIVAAGHRVAMETNLSLPLERYQEFLAAAGENLAYLHASLHLEETSAEAFLAKCLVLRDRISAVPGAGLFAAAVATSARVQDIASAIALFERSGLKLNLQLLLSFMRDGSADYRANVLEPLREHFEPAAHLKQESHRGKSCFAGGRWLLLDMEGDVWRCHAARGEGGVRLGNVAQGSFELDREPRACVYDYCGCPGKPV